MAYCFTRLNTEVKYTVAWTGLLLCGDEISVLASGAGAMLLTKVVLGKVRQVNAFNEVMSCPPGFNSVRIFVL